MTNVNPEVLLATLLEVPRSEPERMANTESQLELFRSIRAFYIYDATQGDIFDLRIHEPFVEPIEERSRRLIGTFRGPRGLIEVEYDTLTEGGVSGESVNFGVFGFLLGQFSSPTPGLNTGTIQPEMAFCMDRAGLNFRHPDSEVDLTGQTPVSLSVNGLLFF